MDGKNKRNLEEQEDLHLISKVINPSLSLEYHMQILGIIDVIFPLLLFAVILLFAWGQAEAKVGDFISFLIFVVRPISLPLLIFIILCCMVVFSQTFLDKAMAMENLSYIRAHPYYIACIWTMVGVSFGLLIWQILDPTSEDGANLPKFIITISSVVLLITSFLNCYIKTLSEYTFQLIDKLGEDNYANDYV